MTDKNDGGPAFPVEGYLASGVMEATGMSLRDWFASQAPITFKHAEDSLETRGNKNPSWSDVFKEMSAMRYAYATFMLAERGK